MFNSKHLRLKISENSLGTSITAQKMNFFIKENIPVMFLCENS